MTDEPRFGEVVAATARWVSVRFEAEACARCARGEGCGAIVAANGRRLRTLRLPNPSGRLQSGDRVQLTISDGDSVRSQMLLFVVPTIALLIGAAVATLWVDDVIAALIGLAIFVAVLVVGARSAKVDERVEIRSAKVDS
ncbi:MAG: SoxR reducing system RseC family protein [Pseudomonadota bacterium]